MVPGAEIVAQTGVQVNVLPLLGNRLLRNPTVCVFAVAAVVVAQLLVVPVLAL